VGQKICGVRRRQLPNLPAICSQQTGQFEYLVSMGRQFWGRMASGGNLPAGADRNTMSPGATASAETACEFGQHESALPKPVVDWQKAPATYQSPVLLAHFKWPEAIVLRKN